MLNYISNQYHTLYLLYLICFNCIFINDFGIYYRFAASEKLRHIWLHRIKSYYPNFKISNNSLVCSKHFSETDFIKNARSITFSLHKNAVPSLFDVEECVYVFNDSKLLCYYLLHIIFHYVSYILINVYY